MPFAYYGAKQRIASKYPAPIYGTVIEPFAGSAGYSMKHIANLDRVILVEIDPAVVDIWHRLKSMTAAELDEIDPLETDERTVEPLVAGLAGGSSLKATLSGRSRKITPWMRHKWPQKKRMLLKVLPYLDRVEVICGDYRVAPMIEATYFVDPPYQLLARNPARTISDQAGNAYRFGPSGIDYPELANWCRQLPGQVIVCEQEPANWLPFQPLTTNRNQNVVQRTEVIWTNSNH